jgi:hypothetical protein
MQVFQTAGVPPRRGRTMRETIGCTAKRRVAEVNRVAAKAAGRSAEGRASAFDVDAAREGSVSVCKGVLPRALFLYLVTVMARWRQGAAPGGISKEAVLF